MPYKSEAQRKYFNANKKELESEGVDVDEYNKASKGKKLPERANDNDEDDKKPARLMPPPKKNKKKGRPR